MSPEQVEGKDLDARSDIFSLGAVLYEMVTGQRAFEGKSQLSVASAILEKEPAPISTLKPMSPRSLDHVIRRCFAKDPDDRWQTARDVALELDSILQSESVTQSTAVLHVQRGSYREWIAWGAATILFATTAYFLFRPHAGSELRQPTLRVSILPPEKHQIYPTNTGMLSPDGHFLAFPVYTSDGSHQLWLRPVDALSARQLPGTEGAYNAFWSPDSQWIAFFSGDKLKKIPLDGGAPLVICSAPAGRGGSWGPDGTIYSS